MSKISKDKKNKSKKFDIDNERDISLFLVKKNREIFLSGEVGGFSAYEILRLFKYLIYLDAKKPILLTICSPGGSVDYGLSIYDYIKNSKTPIYTQCTGFAASMGAVLLAAGKKGHRSATKNSRIMIHQPSGGYIGKASDIGVHAKEIARINDLLGSLLASDTSQSSEKVIQDMQKDYWMTPEEAFKYGLIDEII